MATANIYLTFDGNCLEAFTFYKSVFGGDFQSISRFSEMPPQEGMPPLPESEMDRVMHVSIPLDGDSVLFGSDTAGGWGPPYLQGNNFSISLDVKTKEEADRLYAALSANGHPTMPMANTFWQSYFGMLTDQFGVNWMISQVLDQ